MTTQCLGVSNDTNIHTQIFEYRIINFKRNCIKYGGDGFLMKNKTFICVARFDGTTVKIAPLLSCCLSSRKFNLSNHSLHHRWIMDCSSEIERALYRMTFRGASTLLFLRMSVHVYMTVCIRASNTRGREYTHRVGDRPKKQSGTLTPERIENRDSAGSPSTLPARPSACPNPG